MTQLYLLQAAPIQASDFTRSVLTLAQVQVLHYACLHIPGFITDDKVLQKYLEKIIVKKPKRVFSSPTLLDTMA